MNVIKLIRLITAFHLKNRYASSLFDLFHNVRLRLLYEIHIIGIFEIFQF